jgi:uncharacterized protein (DUF362 family)
MIHRRLRYRLEVNMTEKRSGSMTRRDFMVISGGVLGGLHAIRNLGRQMVDDPVPGTVEKVKTELRTRVALVHADDRKTGVRKALELLKINPCQGKDVLLKPNFNTSDLCPGSTHNDVLRELLTMSREMGAKKLTIADRSGPEPTEQVLQKKGIRQLAGEFSAQVLDLDEVGENGYVHFDPPGSHWKNGFLAARAVTEAECVVSTCCLKTHGYGGVFTMSLKNSVGIVPRKNHPFMHELHSSPDQRKMIAEINTAYSPALIVIDGLEAFVDGGPMTGTRKAANVFLAGTDRIAIDAVGVAILKELGSNKAIMGKKVFAQEQIARAVELKLGIDSPVAIEIVTNDPESESYARKIRQILLV